MKKAYYGVVRTKVTSDREQGGLEYHVARLLAALGFVGLGLADGTAADLAVHHAVRAAHAARKRS